MNTEKRLSMFCVVFAVLTLSSCASNSTGDSVASESEDGVSLPPVGGTDVTLSPIDQKTSELKPDADSVAPTPPAEEPMAAVVPVAPTETVKVKKEKGEFEYHVKSGQTLMQIAYDVYGDIYKWKHILEMNEDKIKNPTDLSKGLVLSVDQNPKDNISNTEGTPYLIKGGDTLGLISDDVYGTSKKWKKLWNNNKKLIQDPNRIYAGFYLYYLFGEQDRVEKEQFKGLQRPAMLETAPRDVSSVSKQPTAQ
ncbi:MAG: LysM peptidoglycan-binding domain-containing protein [Xanthomonadaceae bacterium]|nr:LysM peptidoglycan-binding domain-containing protein [Xanthomonadaceae bacterium]